MALPKTILLMQVVSLATGSDSARGSELVGCLFQEYRNALVKIESKYVDKDNNPFGPIYGTGFVVSDLGYVITAKHVVDTPKGCELPCERTSQLAFVGESATPHKMSLEDTNEIQDFALLRLPEIVAGWPYMPIGYEADSKLEVGEQVIAMGVPEGFDATVTPDSVVTSMNAQIGGVQKSYRQTSLSLSGGMSGGPVFDSEGRAVAFSILTNRTVPNVGYVSELFRVKNALGFTTHTAHSKCAPPIQAPAQIPIPEQIQQLETKLSALKASFENHAAFIRRYVTFSIVSDGNPGRPIPSELEIHIGKLVPDGPKVTSVNVAADVWGIDSRESQDIVQLDRLFLEDLKPVGENIKLLQVLERHQDLLQETDKLTLYWVDLKVIPTITHEDGKVEKLQGSKLKLNYLLK